jgi:hypothetical protein
MCTNSNASQVAVCHSANSRVRQPFNLTLALQSNMQVVDRPGAVVKSWELKRGSKHLGDTQPLRAVISTGEEISCDTQGRYYGYEGSDGRVPDTSRYDLFVEPKQKNKSVFVNLYADSDSRNVTENAYRDLDTANRNADTESSRFRGTFELKYTE